MAEIRLSYCVGSRHMSQNVDPKVTEKVNPRTKKTSLKLYDQNVVYVEKTKFKVLLCKCNHVEINF